MLFDAHTRCLIGLGGVAQRGIYDNVKTAVDKVGKGKNPSQLDNGLLPDLSNRLLNDYRSF